MIDVSSAWSILLGMGAWQRWRRRPGTDVAEPASAGDALIDHAAAGTGVADGAHEASTEASTEASGAAPSAPGPVVSAPDPLARTETATLDAVPTEADFEPDPAADPGVTAPPTGPIGGGLALIQAAHPTQAVLTAAGPAIAAAASGRPAREVAVVGATVLVGQIVLGWHNDLVDRQRDRTHATPRKPLADGRLTPGTVWYALTIAVLALVPLAISVGVTAGTYFLGSVVVGVLGNVVLRRGLFSLLPWALSFALLVGYLSYGGWGGDAVGAPPQPAMVAIAAVAGIGVHLLRSIWGLVADDADGWTYLPLRLGRRLGTSRLLVLALALLGAALAAAVVTGNTVGLRG